ncbi:unnamed protein product [Lactuca saligna]|uniref:Uncharacterized protein n=1 Tax=Lactuca saligna TaxID=75948 RepID=A0AA35ZNT2_LACSI|nr:unnamed protein product [Lactuca saligna]
MLPSHHDVDAIVSHNDFSIVDPYRSPLPFLSRTKENLGNQGTTMFMEHKELEEQLEKEETHLKPPMSTPMIFEVFDFTRTPDQVTKKVKEKEEEYDGPYFDKKNPERDKTKAKDMGMWKEPKRKHKKDINQTMQESSRKAFNRCVAYKRSRLKMMDKREATLPLNAT